jgi:ketosteroid isomerase-like protein
VTPEQVGRFFAALAGGDADTLREINAPDSVNWQSAMGFMRCSPVGSPA